MMRKYFHFIFPLFSFFFSCKDKTETTKPVVQDITESVYASGVIKSLGQYQVTATVSGTISNVYVKAGDAVRKGQTIVSIKNDQAALMAENAQLDAHFSDVDANQSKIKELQLNINTAKTKLDYDLEMLQRAQRLYKNDAATKTDLDQRSLTYESSKNQYNAALLQLSDFKRQLQLNAGKTKNVLKINKALSGDYTVKSNMDGVLYELYKEKGELVTPQMPLGVIGDSDEFMIELQVDQSDIIKVQRGQQILLTIESNKDAVYEAVVTNIKPYMNERSMTFTVEATFTKAPPTLFPNLTLEGNILLRTKNKALLIPRRFLSANDSVILADKKQTKRKVTTGLKDYQYIEILSGLQANEEIVLPK